VKHKLQRSTIMNYAYDFLAGPYGYERKNFKIETQS
jgi:hypothetical protein